MQAGYTSFAAIDCALSRTVHECFLAGSNSNVTSENIGKFYYSGGHFQHWGEENGLGLMGVLKLTAEYKCLLGDDLDFNFVLPQLAAMISTTGEVYGKFLRKLMKNELRLGPLLGTETVCTLPEICEGAVDSPVPENWNYSLAHWVESEDGAFSSPGYYGFYPCNSANKAGYGVLAHQDKSGPNVYWQSVKCGQEIRKAYDQAL